MRISFLIDQPSLHELVGEIIEQLRMRRRFAEDAEVIDRGDDAAAEQMMPDAIDV